MMISYLYVVILYYIIPRWVLPAVFFPERVWIWNKMYIQVRVQVRVVDKILEHKYKFG
jgi:hypothetical protein